MAWDRRSCVESAEFWCCTFLLSCPVRDFWKISLLNTRVNDLSFWNLILEFSSIYQAYLWWLLRPWRCFPSSTENVFGTTPSSYRTKSQHPRNSRRRGYQTLEPLNLSLRYDEYEGWRSLHLVGWLMNLPTQLIDKPCRSRFQELAEISNYQLKNNSVLDVAYKDSGARAVFFGVNALVRRKHSRLCHEIW